jgi:acyl-CoA reductase-like NAD-dependent aldehyde dehydrogenase
VVGIIVPWNYPLFLAIGPLTGALAAGNRAMIKLSELTPRFAELFAKLIGAAFAPDEVTVINGDAGVARAFAALPFDRLLFTGSTRVGREVMLAAAANLTPVVLELGGKSPALIGPDARFDDAVEAIVSGKLFNAGQTCVAPDYVLLPRGRSAAFLERARQVTARLYPGLAGNADYSSIISAQHVARLDQLIAEVSSRGAMVHTLSEGGGDASARRYEPVLVTGDVSVRDQAGAYRLGAAAFACRWRHCQRHLAARGLRRLAVWRRGRQRDWFLSRNRGLPRLLPHKGRAGAVAPEPARAGASAIREGAGHTHAIFSALVEI